MKSSDLMTHPASLDPPPLPLSFNYGLYRSLNFNLKNKKLLSFANIVLLIVKYSSILSCFLVVRLECWLKQKKLCHLSPPFCLTVDRFHKERVLVDHLPEVQEVLYLF